VRDDETFQRLDYLWFTPLSPLFFKLS
jgi:hypothetical protein